MTSTIDISILRGRLHYNSESGDLIWKDSGALATRQNPKNSRLEVRIKQIIFQAHRICWVLHYGEWPPHHIDHINRDVTDNRICNLRKATPSQNQRNMGVRRDSPYGRKGVYTSKYGGRFSARIRNGKSMKYLGTFDTIDEASHAYNKAAVALFGEFACLNPIGSDYE